MLEPPPAVRLQMFFLVLFINVLNVWVLLVLSEPTLLTQVRPSQVLGERGIRDNV